MKERAEALLQEIKVKGDDNLTLAEMDLLAAYGPKVLEENGFKEGYIGFYHKPGSTHFVDWNAIVAVVYHNQRVGENDGVFYTFSPYDILEYFKWLESGAQGEFALPCRTCGRPTVTRGGNPQCEECWLKEHPELV